VPAQFEHLHTRASPTSTTPWNTPPVPNYAAPGALPFDATYTAAWQPPGTYPPTPPRRDPPFETNIPKMIRIVVGVDDPDGRMTSTQYYEYVIELP
jgi:hypothetical protein